MRCDPCDASEGHEEEYAPYSVAQSRLSSIQSVRCGGSSSKEGEVVDQIKVGEAEEFNAQFISRRLRLVTPQKQSR